MNILKEVQFVVVEVCIDDFKASTIGTGFVFYHTQPFIPLKTLMVRFPWFSYYVPNPGGRILKTVCNWNGTKF